MEVIVTDVGNTSVVQNPHTSTVVVTQGLLPPASVGSLTNSGDVDVSNLQDGGILIYNSATQKWTASNLLEKHIFEAGQF